jgi:hypothetical protein
MTSGCTTTDQLVANTGDKPRVAQLTAIWNNQLIAGVDPVHNGAPMVGLAGRVFLFGPDQKEYLLADGKLVVELYATPPEQPQAAPVRMEVWEITKDKLNTVCLRKDFFGQGYTLNLPWPSYRPDITRVQLRPRYEPEKGTVVYGPEEMLALNNGAAAAPVYSKRVETGDRQMIAAPSPLAPGPQAGAIQQTGAVLPAGAIQQVGAVQPPSAVPPAGGMQAPPVMKSFDMQLPGALRR